MSDSRAELRRSDGTILTLSATTSEIYRKHQADKAANPRPPKTSLLARSKGLTQFGEGIAAIKEQQQSGNVVPKLGPGTLSLIDELSARITEYQTYLELKTADEQIDRKRIAVNVLLDTLKTNDLRTFQQQLVAQHHTIKIHRSDSLLGSLGSSQGEKMVRDLKQILADYSVPESYEMIVENIQDMLEDYQHHLEQELRKPGGTQDEILVKKIQINTTLRSTLQINGLNRFMEDWEKTEKDLKKARATSFVKKQISVFFKSYGERHVDKMNAYLEIVSKQALQTDSQYITSSANKP